MNARSPKERQKLKVLRAWAQYRGHKVTVSTEGLTRPTVWVLRNGLPIRGLGETLNEALDDLFSRLFVRTRPAKQTNQERIGLVGLRAWAARRGLKVTCKSDQNGYRLSCGSCLVGAPTLSKALAAINKQLGRTLKTGAPKGNRNGSGENQRKRKAEREAAQRAALKGVENVYKHT